MCLCLLSLSGFAELRHDSAIFKQAWMALAAPSLGASCPLHLSYTFQASVALRTALPKPSDTK